jgi:signal transduction histidine kinase
VQGESGAAADRSDLGSDSKKCFEAEAAQRSARATVFVSFACGTLLLGWSVGDFDFFPDHAIRFLLYRIVATVLCGLLATFAWRASLPKAKYAAIWLWFVVWGAVNAVMIPSTPEYMLTHIFVLVISQIGSPSFIVWPVAWGVTKSLALLIVGEVALSHGGFAGYDAFAAHAYLISGVAFNAVGTRVRYRAEQTQYRTKEELASALHRAREVDRLKNEFFANVSHELRTPLTLILSPVEDLLTKQAPGAERNALKVIRRNATRLLRMIDDLLDLARLEVGGLRLRVLQIDPANIAKTVAANARPAASARKIALRFSASGEPTEIYGDPHRIEIIVTNLVGNALKFTPEGGHVDVRVIYHAEGVHVEVSDTGVGIPNDQLDMIFDRFHQTETSERRRAGGVGIGLALARELAQLHGGSLTAVSELGKGSTFTLSLKRGDGHFDDAIVERRRMQTDLHPARRAGDALNSFDLANFRETGLSLPPNQARHEPVLLDRGRRPRVLVAEDEDELRAFIVSVLSETYDVDSASNGAEALAQLERRRPDLILTDVMMPEVSGLDLTRRVKEDSSLRHTPVILLTARGENEAALEGYEAGADDFVSKPFHTRVLEARIRAHLKMRGLSLQLADQARLASAGTLAAGLAHEVKNPLNAAVNAAKVLESGGSSRVPSEKLLALIIDALTRINAVISALDAHARPADGDDLAPCNVRNAVESTLNLLEHKLKDRVRVHQDYESTGDIFAPARAFNQVLLNLVDNAIRSSGENIWIELRQQDGIVSVSVADDGPGVPPDVAHRIFDPFFTTRAEGEGTGLGLHLSRRIARECGGELRYEPRPGGGARFVMEIPAMEQAA